jgi:hypothetical protein
MRGQAFNDWVKAAKAGRASQGAGKIPPARIGLTILSVARWDQLPRRSISSRGSHERGRGGAS